MEPRKSLDDSYNLIAALLCDVSNSHGSVFNTTSLRNTLGRVKRRLSAEGIGFLTKTLPRLGKAFDKALSGNAPLTANVLGFAALDGGQLPSFLGELFREVLQPNGMLLEHPCVLSVGYLRDVLYSFYKYELPYTDEQEHQVVLKFTQTEADLSTIEPVLSMLRETVQKRSGSRRISTKKDGTMANVAREARILLSRVFAYFDPKDIHPRHGPGAVATKQKRSEKYVWTNVSAKITDVYPFDAYFTASLGHVCDNYDEYKFIGDVSHPARVILVPKDSRGPRLISCEPVDFQWVQQGLGQAIVDLVERHPSNEKLIRGNVRFTDQSPNQIAALYGSESGKYATLDLNEASDRISTALVRLLFPDHVYTYLEACRTSSTVLPSGEEITLRKYAPMGSCLCFPVLALTIWSILTAAAPDADTRESIYVYGDDVIVPTTFVENAIKQLESFGLKLNRDKSCTSGLFRESCGMDAFQGVNVTPVRLRTVWSWSPRPDVYTSWIAYANSYWDKRYYRTYEFIVSRLHHVYGGIPSDDMYLTCPSLRDVPNKLRPERVRTNKRLQKREYRVWDVKSPVHTELVDGWSMLLRYFAEATDATPFRSTTVKEPEWGDRMYDHPAFSVGQYTSRRVSMLTRRWR
jgi:hypothetical protein